MHASNLPYVKTFKGSWHLGRKCCLLASWNVKNKPRYQRKVPKTFRRRSIYMLSQGDIWSNFQMRPTKTERAISYIARSRSKIQNHFKIVLLEMHTFEVIKNWTFFQGLFFKLHVICTWYLNFRNCIFLWKLREKYWKFWINFNKRLLYWNCKYARKKNLVNF